jgi:hypothetical protein
MPFRHPQEKQVPHPSLSPFLFPLKMFINLSEAGIECSMEQEEYSISSQTYQTTIFPYSHVCCMLYEFKQARHRVHPAWCKATSQRVPAGGC